MRSDTTLHSTCVEIALSTRLAKLHWVILTSLVVDKVWSHLEWQRIIVLKFLHGLYCWFFIINYIDIDGFLSTLPTVNISISLARFLLKKSFVNNYWETMQGTSLWILGISFLATFEMIGINIVNKKKY